MKKAIMKKWVAALRSGEYQQGEGVLREVSEDRTDATITKFCCLGVLCNLHAQEHPAIAKTQTDPECYLDETDCLPAEVMSWAGMRTADGQYPGDSVLVSHIIGPDDLAEDNDSGETFTTIANTIEKYWKQL